MICIDICLYVLTQRFTDPRTVSLYSVFLKVMSCKRVSLVPFTWNLLFLQNVFSGTVYVRYATHSSLHGPLFLFRIRCWLFLCNHGAALPSLHSCTFNEEAVVKDIVSQFAGVQAEVVGNRLIWRGFA